MREVEIKAVRSHYVEEQLRKHGPHDAFVENRIPCYVCGSPVNEDGMASLRRSGERLGFSCDAASCHNAAIKGMPSK